MTCSKRTHIHTQHTRATKEMTQPGLNLRTCRLFGAVTHLNRSAAELIRGPADTSGASKPSRRREFCHSAAPPSPVSRRFDMDGEGVSARWQSRRRCQRTPARARRSTGRLQGTWAESTPAQFNTVYLTMCALAAQQSINTQLVPHEGRSSVNPNCMLIQCASKRLETLKMTRSDPG